jgi:hypothetical protein
VDSSAKVCNAAASQVTSIRFKDYIGNRPPIMVHTHTHTHTHTHNKIQYNII